MLNAFPLNSGPLDAQGLGIRHAASASVSAACAVAASATRRQVGAAACVVSAGAGATAWANRYGSAQVQGVASVYAGQTHRQAARAVVDAGGGLSAHSFSALTATAHFQGSASVYAVPANVLGRASVSVSAALQAAATRQQPAAGVISGGCVVSASALVTRHVSGVVSAGASLYCEVGINGVHESFAAFGGSASV